MSRMARSRAVEGADPGTVTEDGEGGRPLGGGSRNVLDSSAQAPKCELEHVDIRYPSSGAGKSGVLAVRDLSFRVEKGEFVAIVGPSGCGKSTTILGLAGLIKPARGCARVNGEIVTKPGVDRAVAFQQASLLPWRSLVRNVEYGMELNGTPRNLRRKRAFDLLEAVGLRDFSAAFPNQLSGGMQQRANLARALANEPDLLLLDEPFASLDAITRERMQNHLVMILRDLKVTVLLVTHQVDEAVLLADRVLVMSARPGRVLADIGIDLPRPRPAGVRRTPEFIAYEQTIWDSLDS